MKMMDLQPNASKQKTSTTIIMKLTQANKMMLLRSMPQQ
jgi:hypothetical protein